MAVCFEVIFFEYPLMILTKRTLFFKSATVIFEDDKAVDIAKSREYSSILVLSYHKLNLPGFIMSSKPTLLINLERGEEEIFRDFNDTTRNEIRKTQNMDKLSIIEKEAPDDISYNLYQQFEYSQGRVPVTRQTVAHSMFWGAYFNSELISGIYVTRSSPYLRIRSIFSQRLSVESRERYKLIGYATRRLVWEICLWGKDNNFTSLDLASVNIHNPNTESIAKFKMSFGKNLTNEYIYTYKSKLFATLEKVVFLKLFFKRIFR